MCILTGFPDQFTCIALNDVVTFGIGIDNFTEKHKHETEKHIMITNMKINMVTL